MNTENLLDNKDVICNCSWCGRDQDTRFGVCFDCAEAQCIIATGKDMYERGVGGDKFPIIEVDKRIKMLIEKGWTPPKDRWDK